MHRLILLLALPLALAALVQLTAAPAAAQDQTSLVNPASQNCVKQGGRLVLESAGDGGKYGVCVFEDNRQCEEWALMRGDCPDGGIKVTGYVTAAGRYCAIRGGRYSVTKQETPDAPEEGDCRLPDGTTCTAEAFYDGSCPKS